MGLLRKSTTSGWGADPAPEFDGTPPDNSADYSEKAAELAGSVQIRHVDAGSCNGCEVEIASALGPAHAHGHGARLVSSPRHADALLVTGAVTRNMEAALRRTYESVPKPRTVVALGDCARDCGVFAGAYGVVGAVGEVVPVDVEVPGCPPPPEAIVEAFRGLTRR